jgi:hypothetical protein
LSSWKSNVVLFTSVPSMKSILSTKPSTRARTSTFCGESSWPIRVVESGTSVVVISITSTTGGGGGATSGFLQAVESTIARHGRNAVPDARNDFVR